MERWLRLLHGCRMLAHDALQHGDPGARGLLLAAAGHPHGLEHLDQVPIVRAEKAERRHHRHADGAGEEKWPEREWRGLSEEGDQHVATGAERPVALNRDHLAASKSGHQIQRDGRPGAGNEPHAVAISARATMLAPRTKIRFRYIAPPPRK